MEITEFTAGINDDNRRIDKVIRIFLPRTNLTDIYKAIRKGLIKVNNKKVDCNFRVKTNDIISIPNFIIISDNQFKTENHKKDINLAIPEIIFENENIIILNKPYDMLVQGNDSSLDKIIQTFFKEKNNSLSFNPGPLHRLDRKTTGIIAFSKSLKGAQWFSENIKNHSIQKKYKTILEGEIINSEIWEDFIEKKEDNLKSFHKVSVSSKKDSEISKKAYTIVNPIQTFSFNKKKLTYAEIIIKTGRMHQIRAQSSLHKHPLFGDIAYGGEKINSSFSKKDFFLHAYKVIIPENPIGLPEEITIDLPEDFNNFLTQTCDIKISRV